MSEDQKPELTPEQLAELQDYMDQQTVFSLATLMVDLHVASAVKDKSGLVNVMLKLAVVLKNNPGFIPRFKAAQREIIERIQKSTPKELVKE